MTNFAVAVVISRRMGDGRGANPKRTDTEGECAVCRATTSKRTPRSHIRAIQWRSKCSTVSKAPHRGHRLSSRYGSIFPMSAYPDRSRAMMRSRIPPDGRQRSQTRRSAGCRALYHAAAEVARSSVICAARMRSRRRQRKSACTSILFAGV